MSFFSFTKNFGKSKVESAGAGIVKTLAKWDPEGASEAEIKSIEDSLDSVLKQVSSARNSFKIEQKEADDIMALYEKRLQAAEILQGQLAGGELSAKKTKDVEKSLDKLVSSLESMSPDIEREKQEAEEAKEFMEQLEEIAQLTAEKLKGARVALKDAKRNMEKADARKQMAETRAEQTALVNGLRDNASSMGSALAAMQANAQESDNEAEALKMKTSLLSSNEDDDVDSLVDSLTAKEATKNQGSVLDRLSALKK